MKHQIIILLCAMLCGCAYSPSPLVLAMQRQAAAEDQQLAAIRQMPDGPAKLAAMRELKNDSAEEVRLEAQVLSALSESEIADRMSEPAPYIDPYPTPIQVQIIH